MRVSLTKASTTTTKTVTESRRWRMTAGALPRTAVEWQRTMVVRRRTVLVLP
jgi:hypothetical protein